MNDEAKFKEQKVWGWLDFSRARPFVNRDPKQSGPYDEARDLIPFFPKKTNEGGLKSKIKEKITDV